MRDKLQPNNEALRQGRSHFRLSNGAPRAGLARALSKMGYCSRSQATELVRAGRVRLNGTLGSDPETPVLLERDQIEVDGRPARAARKVYWMLNKPRGVLVTAADEKHRETVYHFLPDDLPWIAPAGRLDKASEGLLLLTNDSEWAARITAPGTHLEKTYHVQVNRLIDAVDLQRMTRGVRDKTGETLRAKRARILRAGERNCWLEIALDEGKNRQIRRILGAMKMETLRLVRVAIGPLELGALAKGASRELIRGEKQTLDRTMDERRRQFEHARQKADKFLANH